MLNPQPNGDGIKAAKRKNVETWKRKKRASSNF